MIAYLTNDLIFQSRVVSAARSAEIPIVCETSLDKLLAKLADQPQPNALIVDLTLKKLDLTAICEQVRSAMPETALITYGPHVQTQSLEDAQRLGFDLVLTRGQFDRNLAEILSRYARHPTSTEVPTNVPTNES